MWVGAVKRVLTRVPTEGNRSSVFYPCSSEFAPPRWKPPWPVRAHTTPARAGGGLARVEEGGSCPGPGTCQSSRRMRSPLGHTKLGDVGVA